MTRLCLTLLALTCLAGAARAAERELQLTTERVVVFKNGYCLVVKRGVATTGEDGTVFTDEVPDAAVLGSFWATPEAGKLVSVKAGWETREETIDKPVGCTQVGEVLEANVGQTCTIQTTDDAVLRGVIAKVLAAAQQTALDAARLRALGLGEAASGERATLATSSASYFVLRTGDGDQLLPISAVRSLQIAEMKTTLTRKVTRRKKTKRLTFRFAEAGQQRVVRVMYFRPGVRWIPSYRIDLGGEETDDKGRKTASLSLQAELLNEAEDLKGAQINLVVGVPNFRFQSVPSPMILEQTLRRALVQAAPQIMGNRSQMSNALYTQRAGERGRVGRPASGGTASQLPPELSASRSQDLFVYKLPALSLAKGERMVVPIFTAKVPYKDVYTWQVHTQRAGTANSPSAGAGSPLKISKNTIWHQIELINTSGVPLTTGAAMLLDGAQPLAQELLTYTSVGDAVRVPVTVAVDVSGGLVEKETKRLHSALTWGGHRYTRIDRRSTLSLCNHKAAPITIEVVCDLPGKATAASKDGAISLSEFRRGDWAYYRGHPAVNNHSTIRWTLTLKPDEPVELTVDLHYFLRE